MSGIGVRSGDSGLPLVAASEFVGPERPLPLSQRQLRDVNAFPLPMPPLSRDFALVRCREAVVVDLRSYVARGCIRKRIAEKQPEHLRRTLEQALQKLQDPWIGPVVSQCREPHLPVQTWLVRLDPRRVPCQASRLVPEFVGK